jgi:ATP-dependent DNA helicase RecG
MKFEREGRQIEYKQEIDNYKAICKSIVAFANDIGGTITIGVQDKTFNISNLSDTLIEQYLEDLPKAIFDTISPYCVPEITTQLIDSKTVILIKVNKGEKKPYFIKSEGIPKGVYIRIGAHNKRVTKEILEDLQREAVRKYWDEESTNCTPSDLDTTILKQFYNGIWNDQLLESDFVTSKEPFNPNTLVTNAGVIFFHSSPTTILPSSEILYTEYEGTTQDKAIKTEDINAPLPIAAEKIMQLTLPRLIETEKIVNLKRIVDTWLVPQIVFREAIINALVHRKYSIPDAIKVAVFDDRIEIFSPGNFPGPINISELGNGISYARNPRLRHLCRKAGLVEKRGMGFRIMIDACQKNGNPSPLIEEGSNHVKVTLFLHKSTSSDTPLPDELSPLEEYRSRRQSFQTHEASQLLGVSINTAR